MREDILDEIVSLAGFKLGETYSARMVVKRLQDMARAEIYGIE